MKIYLVILLLLAGCSTIEESSKKGLPNSKRVLKNALIGAEAISGKIGVLFCSGGACDFYYSKSKSGIDKIYDFLILEISANHSKFYLKQERLQEIDLKAEELVANTNCDSAKCLADELQERHSIVSSFVRFDEGVRCGGPQRKSSNCQEIKSLSNDPKDFIGLKKHDLDELTDNKDKSFYWLVGTTYIKIIRKIKGTLYLLIYRKNKRSSTVTDSILYPANEKENVVELCNKNGKIDYTLFGVVEVDNSKKEYIPNTVLKLNTRTGKLKKISSKGVICPNESYGMN